ncbi:MAG: IS701 family transposase [Bacteroidetes bacterium]|nr:IS701 family transposase [Bacteroidota bacterium]
MAIPKSGPDPLSDLSSFLEPFAGLVLRSESRKAMERYATGLLADLSRKTAADIGRSLPGTSSQRLQEFLTNTDWDPGEMNRIRIARMVELASAGNGVLIIDDTGLPKKGTHSVGVARQYSGTLGRIDNCQILVSAHYVDRVFDWPVSARLYLPKTWTNDEARCRRAHVPENTPFQTKGAIALGLVDEAGDATVRAVVADAGYGDQPLFLDGLERRKMPYVVGIASNVEFRLARDVHADTPGEEVPYQGQGRPRKAPALKDRIAPLAGSEILDACCDWQKVAWRDGLKGSLVKQCTRVRVFRTGKRGAHLESEGWLIGERPLPGRGGDHKQYFAWGMDKASIEDLVELMHVRWVIERFYQDAKGELGLDDYEGRLWNGLHRHVALVMLAHSFLSLGQSYGPEITGLPPPSPPGISKGTTTPPGRGFPPKGSQKRGSAQAHRPGRALSTSR